MDACIWENIGGSLFKIAVLTWPNEKKKIQIDDNYNRNNSVKFERRFTVLFFEHLNDKVWFPDPLKAMAISIFLNRFRFK